MPSFTTAALATAFFALTSALPTPVVAPVSIAKRSFRINQVATGASKASGAGAAAMAKAHAKFGSSVPSHILAAVDAVSTGSVVATPDGDDLEYLCPVDVGGTTMNLDFDTGSSDLWVFSSSLGDTGSHAVYTPGSSASQISGASWLITYGDGSGASGDVYSDTVAIGGTTVTSQAVEAATSASAQFTSGNNDGLVGLAFPSINTVKPTKQATFMENAIDQGLPASLFTVNLLHEQPGSYNFGEIDSSEYSGDITYTDVDSSQGFWAFNTNIAGTDAQGAIADTGTTLMLVDDSIVDAYYKGIDGATQSSTDSGYIFPCSATAPDVPVVIEGVTFTVSGSIINFSPSQSDSSMCFGGLQSNTGIGFSILGDIFLKAVFVVFDQSSTPRLGFANKAGS